MMQIIQQKNKSLFKIYIVALEDCKVKDLWESETCNQNKHLNKVVHVLIEFGVLEFTRYSKLLISD